MYAFTSRKLEDGDDVVCRSLSPLGVYAYVYKFVREHQVEKVTTNAALLFLGLRIRHQQLHAHS